MPHHQQQNEEQSPSTMNMSQWSATSRPILLSIVIVVVAVFMSNRSVITLGNASSECSIENNGECTTSDNISEEEMELAMRGLIRLSTDGGGQVEKACQNEKDDEVCETMAKDGQCLSNSEMMLSTCQKSCHVCFPRGINTFNFGVEQMVDYYGQTHINDQIKQNIQQTISYMKNDVLSQPMYNSVRRYCQNTHAKCSYWASKGNCDDSYNDLYDANGGVNDGNGPWVQINCAPSCQSCLALEFWNKCSWDTSDTLFQDVLKSGDVNTMFRRIVEDGVIQVERIDNDGTKKENLSVTVLSQPAMFVEEGGEDNILYDEDYRSMDDDDFDIEYYVNRLNTPWLVSIPNFLTEEECSHLITLGHKIGFDKSTEESSSYESAVVSEGRTSRTAWCDDDDDEKENGDESKVSICARDPIARGILTRIEQVTGIPEPHFEPMQFLWYEKGQFFEEHHDFIDSQVYRSCGPRVLTFFLYLNDVEKGGETRFTKMQGSRNTGNFGEDSGNENTITVVPKKGTALLWSNVLDDDPSRINEQAYHEAMAVKRGFKYAINVWIHLRNHKITAQRGCN